ncbi:MAG TPA: ATP-binding protein, partial [Bacillaceae bacterium]|nr:ATP-binding protein [Bacillaceae bacterium]
MKSNSRISAKLIPLVIGFVSVVAATIWAFSTMNSGKVIPFSSIEDTIQAQNGELVTLTEKVDGTIYIDTPD